MRSENAVSSLYKKRTRLFWPIARKKKLINLHSVGFFTIFVLSNLVHAHKFHINLKGHSQLLDRADLHTTVAALKTLRQPKIKSARQIHLEIRFNSA